MDFYFEVCHFLDIYERVDKNYVTYSEMREASWDAHDLRSVSLAEKLGYHRGEPYTVYWLNWDGTL